MTATVRGSKRYSNCSLIFDRPTSTSMQQHPADSAAPVTRCSSQVTVLSLETHNHPHCFPNDVLAHLRLADAAVGKDYREFKAVSYTHLTLPTIYSV